MSHLKKEFKKKDVERIRNLVKGHAGKRTGEGVGYTKPEIFHEEGDRYSWWTYRFGARDRNIGWRIDYFFINEGMVEICKDADIHHNIFGSDHCPVSLTLDL